MSERDGWTLEAEAAAGAIGGHAGTHRAEGLASGDTLGGTTDAAHDVIVEAAPVIVPEEPGETPEPGAPASR